MSTSKSLSGGPKISLLAIVGPTASGKSALALKIAQKFGGEIICADSRTIYKGLDIGTAKPTEVEQAAIKHHLLDVVKPNQVFTVVDFKRLAQKAINDIKKRGKLPIIVGGSGLYVDAVLYDFSFTQNPERDATNPRHSAKNVIKTKKPISSDILLIGLNPDPATLKQNIIGRVEKMLNDGLEKEVRGLSKRFGWEGAMSGVGYQEWRAYLAKLQTLEDTKQLIITHSLQYAKRQRTWFLRNSDIQWFDNQKRVEQFLDSKL